MPILDLAHYYLFDMVLGWLSLPLWKERRIVARVEDGPDEECARLGMQKGRP